MYSSEDVHVLFWCCALSVYCYESVPFTSYTPIRQLAMMKAIIQDNEIGNHGYMTSDLVWKMTHAWLPFRDLLDFYISRLMWNPLTANISMPTTATTATVPTLPRNNVKSPIELMAARRRELETMILSARWAELQKPSPIMAVKTNYKHVNLIVNFQWNSLLIVINRFILSNNYTVEDDTVKYLSRCRRCYWWILWRSRSTRNNNGGTSSGNLLRNLCCSLL